MSGSGTYTSLPPLAVITDDDHGGLLIISIWASFFVALAFVAVRLSIRIMRATLRSDDYALMAATTFSVIACALVQNAVSHGLGKKQKLLIGQSNETVSKNLYAGAVFNIMSQACSKVSVALLFHHLQPPRPFLQLSYAQLGFVAAWCFAAFFATVFRCHLPKPWALDSTNCPNLAANRIGIAATNIATELSIVILPLIFMPTVQVSWTRRLQVASAFMVRLAYVGILAANVFYAQKLSDLQNDPTWSATDPAIWGILSLNVGLLTACIPGMQKVLADLTSGMTALTVRDGHTATSHSGEVFGPTGALGSKNRNPSGAGLEGNKMAWEMSNIRDPMRSECYVVGGAGRSTTRSQGHREDESESVKGLMGDIVVTQEFEWSVDASGNHVPDRT